MQTRTCYDCSHLERKKGKYGLTEPYCELSIKNKRDDPNRKDGKCLRFEKIGKKLDKGSLGLEKEKVAKLSNAEKWLLVSMLRVVTDEGPLPTEGNIQFFTRDYVKNCFSKIYPDLTKEGKVLAYGIAQKLSL